MCETEVTMRDRTLVNLPITRDSLLQLGQTGIVWPESR